MSFHFGQVKWYNATKAYGFITPLQGVKQDVFVHFHDLCPKNTDRPALCTGEYVQYELGDASDGTGRQKATNVTGIYGGPLLCDHGRVTFRSYRDSQGGPRKSLGSYSDQKQGDAALPPPPGLQAPPANEAAAEASE
tara:strand:- start:117 stop:527 length:411 start_codon:yes stop_codon:yes gene_type:complete